VCRRLLRRALLLFHGTLAEEIEHALGFVGHAGVLKLPDYLIADPGCRAPVRLSNGGFESLAEMLFHSLDHVVRYVEHRRSLGACEESVKFLQQFHCPFRIIAACGFEELAFEVSSIWLPGGLDPFDQFDHNR